MAVKNAIVKSNYDVDNDGPFQSVQPADVVDAPILHLATYTVATATIGTDGELAFFSDGNNGLPCLAVWTTIFEATAWFRIALGEAISADPPA